MLEAKAGVSAVNVSDIGPKIAECQATGQHRHHTIEVDSIMQAARQRMDQPEETRTECNVGSGNDSVVNQLCEVTNYGEFDNDSTQKVLVNVKGRLNKHIDFWKKIGTSKFILSVISEGYRLPFIQTPPGRDMPNNKSAFEHCNFVSEAIRELLLSGRVLEVPLLPHVINPLSVSVQRSGKKRLILDLRHVNQYLEKQKIKYEDWKVGLSYFQKGAFMISFDLKSGYHHIEIHTEYRTFLGFAWKFPDGNARRYFIFTVLPFGLSTAPHIFTKTLKSLVKHWRYNGISLGLFLDDGWLTENEREACQALSQNIRSDLTDSGLITNEDKCQWEPCQVMEWLGLVWDTFNGYICVTERRLTNMLEGINSVFQKNFLVSPRQLASLVGKIISAGAVFGNIARLMTRYCSISIAAAQDWDSVFLLDEYCQRELVFWQDNAKKLNIKYINNNDTRKSNYVIYSDASSTGCGAHFDFNGEKVCHRQWDEHESQKSSTWRELTAIEFALDSFLPLLKGTYVKWFSDSQTACKIISVGSMRSDLHVITLKIFQICADNAIHLDIQWIPRTELEKADFISRIIDIDDWQITETCFEAIERLWGVHTVDCFANYYNKKISKYFSRFWNPGSSGVDFFVQNLKGENCLVVPPVELIVRVLHYLYVCKATATIIVPFWPSSQFWPVLVRKCVNFIVGYQLFSGRTALVHGRNTNSLLGSNRFWGDILAVRLQFDY